MEKIVKLPFKKNKKIYNIKYKIYNKIINKNSKNNRINNNKYGGVRYIKKRLEKIVSKKMLNF